MRPSTSPRDATDTERAPRPVSPVAFAPDKSRREGAILRDMEGSAPRPLLRARDKLSDGTRTG